MKRLRAESTCTVVSSHPCVASPTHTVTLSFSAECRGEAVGYTTAGNRGEEDLVLTNDAAEDLHRGQRVVSAGDSRTEMWVEIG